MKYRNKLNEYGYLFLSVAFSTKNLSLARNNILQAVRLFALKQHLGGVVLLKGVTERIAHSLLQRSFNIFESLKTFLA